MKGIEVQGHVIKGGEVGGVYSTTLGADIGDVRAIEYIHWKIDRGGL